MSGGIRELRSNAPALDETRDNVAGIGIVRDMGDDYFIFIVFLIFKIG